MSNDACDVNSTEETSFSLSMALEFMKQSFHSLPNCKHPQLNPVETMLSCSKSVDINVGWQTQCTDRDPIEIFSTTHIDTYPAKVASFFEPMEKLDPCPGLSSS